MVSCNLQLKTFAIEHRFNMLSTFKGYVSRMNRNSYCENIEFEYKHQNKSRLKSTIVRNSTKNVHVVMKCLPNAYGEYLFLKKSRNFSLYASPKSVNLIKKIFPLHHCEPNGEHSKKGFKTNCRKYAKRISDVKKIDLNWRSVFEIPIRIARSNRMVSN